MSGKLSWIEGESLAADGSVTPVEVRAGRVEEYGGKPALLLHVRDITERRSAAGQAANFRELSTAPSGKIPWTA